MTLDADERALLESVERGEWRSTGDLSRASVSGLARERIRYAQQAAATFKKDRRVNIRISSRDLDAIQKRALEEGLPYQTLMASVLHKYATGRL